MQFRTLFTGEQLPVLGFGTWRLGGNMQPDTSRDQEIIQSLQAAIQLGYTHIDTAEMYGGGHTEELVGQAIRPFERAQLQIGTKIWHANLGYADVFRSFEGSLKRLGTDYVDFYIIHLPSAHTPMNETFRALNQLVDRGQIRHLGVSNFNVHQIRQAQEVCNTRIVMSQAPCSLYNRKFIKNGTLGYCNENDILMAAYSPFERGDVLEHPLVIEMAQRYDVTPAQIALHWLTRQPGILVYLMSMDPAHLGENIAALEINLSPEDVAILDNLELPEEKLWPV
jgi:diketogulonate reductase-like aldo/keto reductase